jgi:hypothetical protein
MKLDRGLDQHSNNSVVAVLDNEDRGVLQAVGEPRRIPLAAFDWVHRL